MKSLPMAEIPLKINDQSYSVAIDPGVPLLWVLRDTLHLTGTKYGCGKALCGCCTVLANGSPVRSCVTPVIAASGMEITTIEGLSEDGDHPVQKAWQEEDVPQCGYCQAGQILSAVSLLRATPHPTDEDIDQAMSGNLCRCGTYKRIRLAILRAAETTRKTPL